MTPERILYEKLNSGEVTPKIYAACLYIVEYLRGKGQCRINKGLASGALRISKKHFDNAINVCLDYGLISVTKNRQRHAFILNEKNNHYVKNVSGQKKHDLSKNREREYSGEEETQAKSAFSGEENRAKKRNEKSTNRAKNENLGLRTQDSGLRKDIPPPKAPPAEVGNPNGVATGAEAPESTEPKIKARSKSGQWRVKYLEPIQRIYDLRNQLLKEKYSADGGEASPVYQGRLTEDAEKLADWLRELERQGPALYGYAGYEGLMSEDAESLIAFIVDLSTQFLSQEYFTPKTLWARPQKRGDRVGKALAKGWRPKKESENGETSDAASLLA
jgi:hypothetical protein